MLRHLDKLRTRKYRRAANRLKQKVTFFPWTNEYTLLQGWLATRNHKSKVSTREVGLQSYTHIWKFTQRRNKLDYYDEFGEECNNEVPGVPWEETLYGSDLVDVASEYGGDWEWFVTNVWYSPSRDKYYRGFDAGCSCRTPWDTNVPISDFQVGSKEEVTKRLPQKLKIEVRDFDPTKVVDGR